MISTRLSSLPVSCGSWCYPLLSIFRMVIMLVVLILAVLFALRGYAPEAIIGPVLALVAGAVATIDRLVGVQRVRPVSALPAV
jgi:hypothetical protein